MITGFVLVMMLIIEYVNVQSKGNWSRLLQRSPFMQILLGALLGVIPGCLGTYAVVSLYTHNLLAFPALLAATIATTGDEAYLLFTVNPSIAFLMHGILCVLAIIAGVIASLFIKIRITDSHSFPIHHAHESLQCHCSKLQEILLNFRMITFQRAILLFSIIVFMLMLMHGGEHGHSHSHEGHYHVHGEAWITITFIVGSFLALCIIALVNDHFLEEHLWDHIIKKHFFRIFVWIFATLLTIHFLEKQIDLAGWVQSNMSIVLLMAMIIGLIPVSGPHILFISLYMSEHIPFSILLVNSLMQEGHGGLPLLAESKKTFFIVKGIKIIIAVIIGVTGIYYAW